MNKFIFLILILFTGCTYYDYYSSEYKNNGIAYEQAFKEYIGGDIHPLQDWGFIQKTRAVNPNSNEWTNVPQVITQAEIDTVVKVFSTPKTDTQISPVNWSKFYVQHVYGSHSNMDWLCSYVEVTNQDDHIYNFNATFGSIQLMYDSSTKRFGYHNSLDSKMHYDYHIECINGQYYVGFDFEATGENPNQQEARDYIFNDWIIKICPARGVTKRVIVEDLIAQDNLEHLPESDWDYNDAVFDITYSDGIATITLLAAGGTLPLYVGGHEVHAEFGEDLHPINVFGRITHSPVTFQIRSIDDDIPVIVYNKGVSYELLANMGQAPAKICVSTDYEWCAEGQHIKGKYPKFVEYCHNRIENWYK